LPTVIKGTEWTEDPKTGDGVLEVHLWEEAKVKLDEASPTVAETAGGNEVANFPSNCQEWLLG